MSWEHKEGRRSYYRRAWREGGRIVRQYFRAGEAARIAAEEDRERRRKEREKRQRERIELARLREIGDRMEDYYRRVNAILESTLADAGYQRHSRGEWRKIGQPGNMRKDRRGMAEEKPRLSPEDNQIILRARNGDKAVRASAREIIARHGVDGMCPLVEMARDDLLRKITGKDIAMEEDMRFQMESLRGQLVEPGSSPLEQLLADRIALCWLHLHYFELMWAQTLGEVSQKQSIYYEQGLESAHRRYLSAIRSLAQVRRLRLPSLQLNLANQQINLADRQVNLSGDSKP